MNKLEAITRDIKNWYDTIPFIQGPVRRQKRIQFVPDKIKKLINILYYEYEYGNPTQAKLTGIPKTPYSKIIKLSGIKRRPNNITTNRVKLLRSEKIKGINNPRVFSDKNQFSTGIKGYYNSKNNGVVFFRSCWEYLYARWLDKNNIQWKYEGKQYKLSNDKYYRPDFTIFENDKLKYVVEVKGANKDALYKTNLLSQEYGINVIVVDDIKPYCEQDYTTELKKWKQLQESEK